MPLTHETAQRRYRVYNYTVPELSKDIVRELARDARMPNYSLRSKQEMIDYLNQQEDLPLRNVQIKVFRARQ